MTALEKSIRPVPGTYGLPFFGFLSQSIRFVKGWRIFFADCERKYESTVFRAAAGVKAIVVTDAQGVDAIFNNEKVTKLYGFGPLKPPPARVGGINPAVFTNDGEHDRLKAWHLGLVTAGLPTFAETFDAVASPALKSWTERGELDWGAELDALTSNFLFTHFTGAAPDVADVDGWGFHLLPREPIRFPPNKGDKPVVERLERLVAAVKGAPKWAEMAKSAKEVAGLDEDAAAKQLVFLLAFNAYTGTSSVFRSVLGELMANPDYLKRCVDEVDAVAKEAGYEGGPVSPELIKKTPALKNAIRETLRLHMPAPFAFAKAREDLVIESASGRFQVKKGEVIHGVLGCAQRDPRVFDRPDEFVAERFEDDEMGRGLVWAHGRDSESPAPSNHMCTGRDVVYLTLHSFFFKLLHGFEWSLKEQPVWSDTKLQPANRPATPIVATKIARR
jgi:hydroperoxide dehydratase